MMSSAASSHSSFSESNQENSFCEEIEDLFLYAPYDENMEPLAIEEEAAEYEARMAEEAKEERRLEARFTWAIDLNSWYVRLLACLLSKSLY